MVYAISAPSDRLLRRKSPTDMANRSDDAFSEVTTGRPLSFHDLPVGEALAPALKERENSGGASFPRR